MREPGYYWVREGREWETARWTGYSWWAVCSEEPCADDYWSEIDERRIVREEPSDGR